MEEGAMAAWAIAAISIAAIAAIAMVAWTATTWVATIALFNKFTINKEKNGMKNGPGNDVDDDNADVAGDHGNRDGRDGDDGTVPETSSSKYGKIYLTRSPPLIHIEYGC